MIKHFIFNTDSLAILQLHDDPALARKRFSSLELIQELGLSLDLDEYHLVYSEPLNEYDDVHEFLENVYCRFNTAIPETYIGHSLSVSDIVVIQKNGVLYGYYVQPVGFTELPNFHDLLK
ncbi:MAG: YodL domain-containing protein [Eubacteriales bacterium]|nr:YodL domain-containing protein [Eubacteriales bacterium]